MKRSRNLEHLMRAIALTDDVEIDCTACLDLMPVYVDNQVSGSDGVREMRPVHQHLALCQDCFEEYEALFDLAKVNAEDGLPDRATLLRKLSDRFG